MTTDPRDYDPELLPNPLPRGVTMLTPPDHDEADPDAPWPLQLAYDEHLPEGWQVLSLPGGSSEARWEAPPAGSTWGGARWVRPAPPVQAGDVVSWYRHEIPRRVLVLVPGYSLAVVEDAPNDQDCQPDRQVPPTFAPVAELILLHREIATTATGQAGDRVLDAGEWGTLETCAACDGDGLLHRLDRVPEPTEPTEPEAEEPAWHVVTELPRPTLPGWVSSHDGRTKLRAHSVARIETVVNRTSAAITAYAYDGALVQMVRISTRGEVPSEAAAILDGETARMAEAIEQAVAETEPVVMALIEQGDPAMTIEIDVEDDRGE